MIKNKILFLIFVIVILITSPGVCEKSYASGSSYPGNIKVKVVDFPVKLNNISIDNKYAMYPLLLYKDITYFPMTYDYSKLFGLYTVWDQNKYMLFIGKNNYTTDNLNNHFTKSKNKNMYYAQIANYKIAVNTESNREYITENIKDTYPIINFRNITYFPLTWKYAVDEFGWEYKYSNKDGLIISSNTNISNLIFPVGPSHAFDTSAISGSNQKQQIHNEKWGVLFPIDVYYNENQKIYVKKIDGTSTQFDLKDKLPQNSEFLIGKKGKIKPIIDGDIFKFAVEVNDIKHKMKSIHLLGINLNDGHIEELEVF